MSVALAEAGRCRKRPSFPGPEVERILAITMAVVQELAVTRERLDTLEGPLHARGVVARDEITTFAPNPQQAVGRGHRTQDYLSSVFRIVRQKGEAIDAAKTGELSSKAVASALTADDKG